LAEDIVVILLTVFKLGFSRILFRELIEDIFFGAS
jgi:hypothetical protein